MDLAVDLAAHLCGFPIIVLVYWFLNEYVLWFIGVPCVETKLYYEMVISPHTSRSQS